MRDSGPSGNATASAAARIAPLALCHGGKGRRCRSAGPRAASRENVFRLEAQQKKLNEYGITSIRVPGTTVAAYRQFQQLRDSGRAAVRYSILFRPRDLADFRSSIVEAGIRQGEGDEWVRVWGLKISVDGGFEGGRMTRPYEGELGKGGTYYGLQLVPQESFDAYVAAINRAGWRAAVHAVGDAAVDQVLQGFERADAERDINGRGWTIEHAFVTRPDQYPRIKAMDLRLSVQDHLYLAAPVLKRYWGPSGALARGGAQAHDHQQRPLDGRRGNQGVDRSRQACRLRRAIGRLPQHSRLGGAASEGAGDLRRRPGSLSFRRLLGAVPSRLEHDFHAAVFFVAEDLVHGRSVLERFGMGDDEGWVQAAFGDEV